MAAAGSGGYAAAAVGDLREDPRTGLPLIDVPPAYREYFPQLSGCVMHVFAKVTMVTRKAAAAAERRYERWLLVTDNCAYLIAEKAMINRCIPVARVREAVVAGPLDLVLVLPEGPTRYDLWVHFENPHDRDHAVAVLQTVHQFLTARPLACRRIDDLQALRDVAVIAKPPEWTLEVEPMLPKAVLQEQLRAQQGDYTAEQNAINSEYEKIRARLQADFDRQMAAKNEEFAQFKREYQALQEAHNNLVVQFDVMAQDVDSYVKLLQEKDDEIDKLKSGDHPQIQQLLHDMETQQLRRAVDEERRRGQSSHEQRQAEDVKAQLAHEQEHHAREVQHQRDVVRQRDEEIARLNALLQRRDGELRAADVAVQERNRLLQEKQSDVQQRELKLSERDRELRYTKLLMRDTFKRQVEELDSIRGQFQQYDEQMVAFVQHLAQGQGQGPPPAPAQIQNAIPRPIAPGHPTRTGMSPPPPPLLPQHQGGGGGGVPLAPPRDDSLPLMPHGTADWYVPGQPRAGGAASPSPYRGQTTLVGARMY